MQDVLEPPEALRAFPQGGRTQWPGKAGSTGALVEANPACGVRDL